MVHLDLKNFLIRATLSRYHALCECVCVCVCVCGGGANYTVCECVCVCMCVWRTLIQRHLNSEAFSVFFHVLIFVWRYGSLRCIERYVQAVCVPLNLTYHQMGVTNFQIAF